MRFYGKCETYHKISENVVKTTCEKITLALKWKKVKVILYAEQTKKGGKMNPSDNNPTSPFGAGGATGGVTPSPVDFTNPSNLNTNTSSLSMSDSLSSAKEDLTSAGQAATTGISGAASLSDSGSASMTTPMQSLTPADPVPGSIGSVTSVPPKAPEPMDMSALSGSKMAGSGSAGAGMGTGAAMNAGQPATTSAQSTTPVQPYYNPFTRNNVSGSGFGGHGAAGAAPTSSTNIPPALQPQTEKFSDKLKMPKEKKGNIMALLGWLLAALFAVAAVIFAILWQQAENKDPKVVYVPQEPVQEEISMVSCTQNLGGDAVEGMENLIDRNRSMKATFANGALATIDLADTYNFVDGAAAEAARGYFDGLTGWYGEVAGNLGINAISSNLVIEDNVVKYDVSANKDQLIGDYIGVFMLTGNEDGTVNADSETVKNVYEGMGFGCTVE